MKEDKELQKRLWAQFMGNTVVCGGLLLFVLGYILMNKRDQDSAAVQSELNQFQSAQPNYTDSLRIYDAANIENIEHLSQMLNFLRVNPMPAVNKDSLGRELKNIQAQRQNYINAKIRTDSLMQQHLDSVRNANKYNVFVRNRAMQYSK